MLLGALGERQALKGFSGRIPRQIAPGDSIPFAGASGQTFEGAVARPTEHGITAAVSGRAYYMARSELILEAQDPFIHGFTLPARFGDFLPA